MIKHSHLFLPMEMFVWQQASPSHASIQESPRENKDQERKAIKLKTKKALQEVKKDLNENTTPGSGTTETYSRGEEEIPVEKVEPEMGEKRYPHLSAALAKNKESGLLKEFAKVLTELEKFTTAQPVVLRYEKGGHLSDMPELEEVSAGIEVSAPNGSNKFIVQLWFQPETIPNNKNGNSDTYERVAFLTLFDANGKEIKRIRLAAPSDKDISFSSEQVKEIRKAWVNFVNNKNAIR